ncbi:MAG: TolC family protein, partial [Deltaproteobacteria bacterium]|nr:TolC family protein [Deltaproteobacteria bacterium]
TAAAGWERDASQAALTGGSSPTVGFQAVRASVSQPLFTWGQVGAAVRAAELGLATAAEQLRLARQDAALDVTAAFYDVLLARELHALARSTLEQRLRHREEAEKRLGAGVATDYDVLSARVAAEYARPEVIRSENRIRLARDRLRFLLALEEPEVDASGTLETAPGSLPTYDEALATALERRPELADVRKRLGVSRELVKVAQAGDKPRVDLQAGLGWRRLEAGGAEADGAEWSAGVVATWPLFDGLRTRGRLAQARSREASLRVEERRFVDVVALEVREAGNSLREAEEVLRAVAGTVSQAEELLRMAEQGYHLGVKTKLEVDDAQANLTEAKGSLARARRDHLVASAALARAMGVLGQEG